MTSSLASDVERLAIIGRKVVEKVRVGADDAKQPGDMEMARKFTKTVVRPLDFPIAR